MVKLSNVQEAYFSIMTRKNGFMGFRPSGYWSRMFWQRDFMEEIERAESRDERGDFEKYEMEIKEKN